MPGLSSAPSTSCPTRASARRCLPTRAGRRSRSCSSTANWLAAATSSRSCTRAASCASWSRPLPNTASVVGGGVIGLSAAQALREDGFAVTVHEQHRVGTALGSSSGRSRIYRVSYARPSYCRLARRAIEEWRRLDPALLLENGLLEHGAGAERHAEALAECGEAFEWLEPREAERIFPEARFNEPVLWTQEAGAVLADDALARLREGVEVIEGSHVTDPARLDADVVVVCPGAWLGRMYDLPVHARI